MRDLILLTAFVMIMAYLQAKQSKKILRYNNNLTSTQTEKRDKGTYMIIAMVVMMLLVMLRGVNVGSDTSEYHKIFNNLITNPDYAYVTRYEIGYIFLNKLVGKFSSDPQSIIAVTALIYYIVFIWFLRKHCKNYAFALILFFFICIDDTVNIVRQELAVAFLLIAIDNVLNKKTLFALFWILVASTFHQAAIFFIVMLILPYIHYDHKVSFVIIILVIILTVTNTLYQISLVVAPDYAKYFLNESNGFLIVTYEALKNLSFLIAAITIRHNNIKDAKVLPKSKLNYNLQINLMLYTMLMTLIFSIMSYRLYLFERLVKYMSIFNLVLLCNVVDKIGNENDKKILIAAIVVILMAFAIVYKIARPDWNSMFPYQFFWQ